MQAGRGSHQQRMGQGCKAARLQGQAGRGKRQAWHESGHLQIRCVSVSECRQAEESGRHGMKADICKSDASA